MDEKIRLFQGRKVDKSTTYEGLMPVRKHARTRKNARTHARIQAIILNTATCSRFPGWPIKKIYEFIKAERPHNGF